MSHYIHVSKEVIIPYHWDSYPVCYPVILFIILLYYKVNHYNTNIIHQKYNIDLYYVNIISNLSTQQ